MSVLKAILLGLLQGLTEFLPVSSSGHLKICEKLFGLEEMPLLFDVFLHLATLLVVIIYFRKVIIKFFKIL
ncbi:MAG: undecaprenyl-diphosphatase, partial [Spirochaetaceae bacterium]|nr:undecaprenyl-diphosphatase [Spirochaetaceae bacterium]